MLCYAVLKNIPEYVNGGALFFNQIVGIDETDANDVVRYKRITHLLTVLGAIIYTIFLPFCFLYNHSAVKIVGIFVLFTIFSCLIGIWLNTRKRFLWSKNLVSISVMLLYTSTSFLLGTNVLDGTLLFVYPATLFFAYRPEERTYVVFLVSTALIAYLAVLNFAMPEPMFGGEIPAILAFWVDSASKLILFLFIAVICYFASKQISLNELALAEALAKSDQLLLNILPEPIAERLKQSPIAIADRHDKVAVLFADIANFTPLSEQVSPDALVDLLNHIFSEFDHIAQRHGVEKIKTIGDAYMAAAGVPEKGNDDIHAIAECALEMTNVAKKLTDPEGNSVKLRIGMHCGPAVAGVIGAHKFAYDLWGDTVNTASRMESHGEAGRIHVTEDIHELLKDAYEFESRGEVEIKGKGTLKTWWLIKKSRLTV